MLYDVLLSSKDCHCCLSNAFYNSVSGNKSSNPPLSLSHKRKQGENSSGIVNIALGKPFSGTLLIKGNIEEKSLNIGILRKEPNKKLVCPKRVAFSTPECELCTYAN